MKDCMLSVGRYVKYKNNVVMVVVEKEDRVVLLNPVNGNSKVTVLKTNVEPTCYRPAVIVSHKLARYIVTKLGCIISVKTGRIMKWGVNDPIHVDIMNKARHL